jgi:hypothetical protein
MLRTNARSIGRRFARSYSEPRPPLGQRGTPLAGPHEGVEREAPHPLRVALGEERGAERAGGDPVHQDGAHPAGAGDVVGRGREVVGAGGDVRVDVALLVRPAVAL